MVGQALAENTHWPADKIGALKDEYDAMVQTMRTGEYFPTSRTNCSGYEKFNHLMSEMARVGEVPCCGNVSAPAARRLPCWPRSDALLSEKRARNTRKLTHGNNGRSVMTARRTACNSKNSSIDGLCGAFMLRKPCQMAIYVQQS